jgi:hypothetical protein
LEPWPDNSSPDEINKQVELAVHKAQSNKTPPSGIYGTSIGIAISQSREQLGKEGDDLLDVIVAVLTAEPACIRKLWVWHRFTFLFAANGASDR